MKKNIYGIIDIRSHSLGDLCLLDRDEEFRVGCLSLFTNPSVPDYLVPDLIGYNFGSVTYGDDDLLPHFDITPPLIVISGHENVVQDRRALPKEGDSDA